MRKAFVLSAAMLIIAAGPSLGQTSKSGGSSAADAEANERALWEMLKKNDFVGFDRAVEGMMFVGATGVVPQWKAGLARAFFKGCTLGTYSLDSMQTRTYAPDIVVLSYKATTDWPCGATKLPSPTYETAVWQQVAGKWRVLFGGSTPVAR